MQTSQEAISYAKKLVPEKAGWVEQMPGNIVKLRLGDIDKLQKVFEKLKLANILFEPGNIGTLIPQHYI